MRRLMLSWQDVKNMVAAVKQIVTVRPGGVVEVRSSDLPDGATAEVIVLIEKPAPAPRTLTSFIGAGKGLFQSIEDVDAYVRELRDEWDR